MKLAFLVVGWLILSYAQKGKKNYSSRDYVTAEILRLRNYTFCLTKKKEKKEKEKEKETTHSENVELGHFCCARAKGSFVKKYTNKFRSWSLALN